MHIMLDTEGLSTKDHTLFTHVGAIAFNFRACVANKQVQALDVLELELNVAEQARLGAVIDASTVGWWLTQDEIPRRKMAEAIKNKNAEPLSISIQKLNAFVDRNGGLEDDNVFWAQGPGHDYDRSLEALYYSLNMKVPWQYWQLADSRSIATLFRTVYGVKAIKRKNGHTALEDAAAQIRTMIELVSGGQEIPPWDGTIYKPS